MNLKTKTVHGIRWTSLSLWGRQLLTFVIFTFLARLLDKEAYGLVALAGVYISFIQVFVKEGLSTAIIQRKELEPHHLNTAFWMNIIVAIVITSLTIMFSGFIAILLKNQRISPILAWLSVGIPLTAVSVLPDALLTREMNFKPLAIRTTVGTLIGGLAGVIMALIGFGVWSLVVQQLLTAVIMAIILWKSVNWRPGLTVTKSAFVAIAPFSGSIIGFNILWFVTSRIDQALIGTGLGVQSLGIYFIAQRFVSLINEALNSPIQAVALPAFSKIQDDLKKLARAFERSTTLVCAIIFPAFIGLLLIGPRFIPLVFGQKWAPAILPMQILCVAGILRSAQNFVNPTFIALKQLRYYTYVMVLDATLTTIGCWWAAKYGIIPVAWSIVCVSGIIGIANFAVIKRLVRISWKSLYSGIWPIIMACSIMILLVLGLAHFLSGRIYDPLLVLCQIFIGAVSYVTAFAILARGLWDELWGIAKMLVNRKSISRPIV